MSLFSKSQIYTVHINPSKAHAIEKAVFVREGFSLTAFVFGTFWALYHRLWPESFIIFIVLLSLATMEEKGWMAGTTITILNFAFSLMVGFMANDMRRNQLARKGYIMSEVVVSDNELRAQQRYFDHVLTA